jgi:hypothetical protein
MRDTIQLVFVRLAPPAPPSPAGLAIYVTQHHSSAVAQVRDLADHEFAVLLEPAEGHRLTLSAALEVVHATIRRGRNGQGS